MQTTPQMKIQWALEDAWHGLVRSALGAIKLGLALTMAYSLAPPLWEAIFAPTMTAAYQLPYTAAKRADRVLSVAESLGLKIAAQDSSCGRVSAMVSQWLPVKAGASEVQLLPASQAIPIKKARRIERANRY